MLSEQWTRKPTARLYRWPDERVPFYLRERRARRHRVMREARYIYPFFGEPYWCLHANVTYNFGNVTFLAVERARRHNACLHASM